MRIITEMRPKVQKVRSTKMLTAKQVDRLEDMLVTAVNNEVKISLTHGVLYATFVPIFDDMGRTQSYRVEKDGSFVKQ